MLNAIPGMSPLVICARRTRLSRVSRICARRADSEAQMQAQHLHEDWTAVAVMTWMVDVL